MLAGCQTTKQVNCGSAFGRFNKKKYEAILATFNNF